MLKSEGKKRSVNYVLQGHIPKVWFRVGGPQVAQTGLGIAEAGLELRILILLPPKSQDHRHPPQVYSVCGTVRRNRPPRHLISLQFQFNEVGSCGSLEKYREEGQSAPCDFLPLNLCTCCVGLRPGEF